MANALDQNQIFHGSEDVHKFFEQNLNDKIGIEHVRKIIFQSADNLNNLDEYEIFFMKLNKNSR
jgi:hypothetical protein